MKEISVIPVTCQYIGQHLQVFINVENGRTTKYQFINDDIFNNVRKGDHGFLKLFIDPQDETAFYVFSPSISNLRTKTRISSINSPA